MTAYLLDTNVLSEMSRSRPHQGVVGWLQGQRPITHLSVLTIGELRRGSWRIRPRDVRRADRYDAWIDENIEAHEDRVHAVDREVVECWAALSASAKRTLPPIDGLIAATALVHGLTVATRNVRDFADTGAATFDPFA